MKVYGADRGGVIGEVERTNGGAWFADWLNSAGDVVALGAFPDKGAAIAAVRAKEIGELPPIPRIPTQAFFGPKAGPQ